LDTQVIELGRQLSEYASVASRESSLSSRRAALKAERDLRAQKKHELAARCKRLKQEVVERERRMERDTAALVVQEEGMRRQLNNVLKETQAVNNWDSWQKLAMSVPPAVFSLPGKENLN